MRPSRSLLLAGLSGAVVTVSVLAVLWPGVAWPSSRATEARTRGAEQPAEPSWGRTDLPGRAEPVPNAQRAKYQRPQGVRYPADNAFSPEREELGRVLFFDPRLSGSGSISCASCHNPDLDWGDGLPRAVGHGMKVLDRRTPTVLNLAWAEALFWDGRAETMEEQALGPIEAPGEMNLPLHEMEARVGAIPGYKPLFERAYPGEPISRKTVARALATFQRGLVSAEGPFDRWVRGDESAISESAGRGFVLFNGKANCAACHSGWRFTDDGFHDLGLPGTDRGRGTVLPEIEVSQFAFKTPTLRNVDRRAPYMHDGSVATLEDVIELYDRGGRVVRPSLSREVRPLKLTPQEKADLLAFLKTLTSADKPVVVPALPR